MGDKSGQFYSEYDVKSNGTELGVAMSNEKFFKLFIKALHLVSTNSRCFLLSLQF